MESISRQKLQFVMNESISSGDAQRERKVDPMKWLPHLRSNLVLAFVAEKKRKIRFETFDNVAWDRVLDDFNRQSLLALSRGQIINQLSTIKKLIRDGNNNKKSEVELADPGIDLSSVGNSRPRLFDSFVDSSVISDEDWEIFYDEVKLTAGRPYRPAPTGKRQVASLDSPVLTPVAKTSKIAVPSATSSSSVSADKVSAIPITSSVSVPAAAAVASKEPPIRLSSSTAHAAKASSSSSSSKANNAKHAGPTAPDPDLLALREYSKKEETKLEASMRIIAKDFRSLTGEEQLNVGLALTQPSYQELFLTLGEEGRKAFVKKFKS